MLLLELLLLGVLLLLVEHLAALLVLVLLEYLLLLVVLILLAALVVSLLEYLLLLDQVLLLLQLMLLLYNGVLLLDHVLLNHGHLVLHSLHLIRLRGLLDCLLHGGVLRTETDHLLTFLSLSNNKELFLHCVLCNALCDALQSRERSHIFEKKLKLSYPRYKNIIYL